MTIVTPFKEPFVMECTVYTDIRILRKCKKTQIRVVHVKRTPFF